MGGVCFFFFILLKDNAQVICNESALPPPQDGRANVLIKCIVPAVWAMPGI